MRGLSVLALTIGFVLVISACGASDESIAAAIAETELASNADTPVPPKATSTPWLTPTPQFDPIEREQVSSFCLALLEWFDAEGELIAEDKVFQEQAASGNITSEIRQKPAELHEISMALYTEARNLPRPGPARDAHDKLLDFAGVLVERYLIQSQMIADYTDEIYNQYVDKSQEGDRLFYALFDETDDLYLRYDLDPTDCALIFRSHYPLLQAYIEKTGWYPGPESGMAHKAPDPPSTVYLFVEETDQIYVASFGYVYNTTDEEELRQGFQHIEEVLNLLLPQLSDVEQIISPLPAMVASFTGEEIVQDAKVAGLPIRTIMRYLDPGGSLVRVDVIVSKTLEPASPSLPSSSGIGEFECADPLGCVTYAEGEPVRLASALVISGPNIQLGQDSQYGVEIALETKGEVLGHPLELQVEDDGCSAEGGQTAGQKIVSDPSILGVVGTSCSGAGVPMSKVVSEAGYFMVSPSNTSPALTDPEWAWNAGYYRTAHNDLAQGADVANFAYNELGLTSAAAIHDGDPYTESLANAFRNSFEELGGEVVEYTNISKGVTNMLPVLTAVSAAGPPEFLYFPIFSPECPLIAKQAEQVEGLENTVLAAADGCMSNDIIEVFDGESGRMYISGPDIGFSGAEYDEFLVAYEAKVGSAPISVFHAHAYDATNMIINCVEEVGVVDGDALHVGRQAMRDCLSATSDHIGITGSLTCDAYGDCADPKITISVIEGGWFNPIWP